MKENIKAPRQWPLCPLTQSLTCAQTSHFKNYRHISSEWVTRITIATQIALLQYNQNLVYEIAKSGGFKLELCETQWARLLPTPTECPIFALSVPRLSIHAADGINPLWPSDAIWRHRSRSPLVQVMACCLTAPSHYMNQCWFIIIKALCHLSEGIIMRSEDTNQ